MSVLWRLEAIIQCVLCSSTMNKQDEDDKDVIWHATSPQLDSNQGHCLLPPYLCFSRGRLESTLAASPSSGEPGDVGDGGECLLRLVDSESFRVGKEGAGGVRGDSLRIGEDGKEGEEEEGEEEDTSVLWFQLFCRRVCCCCCCWCCCCRTEIELFSLLGEQSTASNWAERSKRDNITLS